MQTSPKAIGKTVGQFLFRFHALVFTVTVLGGLSIAVLLLNDVIAQSDQSTDYTPSSTDTSFDEQTIERVRELQPSTERPAPVNFPAGRIDPFSQ